MTLRDRPKIRSSHALLRGVLLAKAGAGIALTLAFVAGWWLRAHGLSVVDFQNDLKRGSEPRFQWRSVDKKHWQALGRVGVDPTTPVGEAADVTDTREANGAGCSAGMVRVKGKYRMGEVEHVQDGACVDWISKEFPARCRTFDKEKIASDVAKLPTRDLDFCMDRFEYPNALGQNPMIVVTFHEAESLCKNASKRLCNENEWTFACEGEEAMPYPYGFARDATTCVVDRNWRPFAEGALQPRDGQGARAELDRLWQAEPSGSRAGCRSPFGVHDMTGNVDEWTRSARTTGYASILKGGYWGPVRARCRPATRAHNEDFVAYQQGFRCCADSDAAIPAPRATPPVAGGATTTPAAQGPSTRDGGPVAELAPESPESAGPALATQEGDEAEAIGRARVGLSCDLAARAGMSPWSVPAVAVAGALVAASAARRRRRLPRP